MQLNIKKTNNSNNNYYYYICFRNEKIKKTISFEEVECTGNSKHEIISVCLGVITKELSNSLFDLAKTYQQIQISQDSATILLSSEKPTNKTYCTVNFDIDINDKIIGIEII